MVVDTKKDTKTVTFQNVSDFKKYLEKNRNSDNQRTLFRNDIWTGTETWAEFETYLEEGNKEATKSIKEYTKLYVDKFEQLYTSNIGYEFDVTGEFFDIGAVMVGEPEAWIKQIEIKDEKFIEINIQGTYPHNANLEIVKQNASKLLAIASVLDSQGFSVRLNMVFRQKKCAKRGKVKNLDVFIPIKDYNQPFDYKKMGILVGVPFFRRGIFRVLEIEFGNNLSDNYGAMNAKDGDISLVSDSDISDLERMLSNDKVI